MLSIFPIVFAVICFCAFGKNGSENLMIAGWFWTCVSMPIIVLDLAIAWSWLPQNLYRSVPRDVRRHEEQSTNEYILNNPSTVSFYSYIEACLQQGED